MNNEMYKDLSESLGPFSAEYIVPILVSQDYRKERYGCYCLDESYKHETRVRYKCSACGFGRTVSKEFVHKFLNNSNYCAFCGAKLHHRELHRVDRDFTKER